MADPRPPGGYLRAGDAEKAPRAPAPTPAARTPAPGMPPAAPPDAAFAGTEDASEALPAYSEFSASREFSPAELVAARVKLAEKGDVSAVARPVTTDEAGLALDALFDQNIPPEGFRDVLELLEKLPGMRTHVNPADALGMFRTKVLLPFLTSPAVRTQLSELGEPDLDAGGEAGKGGKAKKGKQREVPAQQRRVFLILSRWLDGWGLEALQAAVEADEPAGRDTLPVLLGRIAVHAARASPVSFQGGGAASGADELPMGVLDEAEDEDGDADDGGMLESTYYSPDDPDEPGLTPLPSPALHDVEHTSYHPSDTPAALSLLRQIISLSAARLARLPRSTPRWRAAGGLLARAGRVLLSVRTPTSISAAGAMFRGEFPSRSWTAQDAGELGTGFEPALRRELDGKLPAPVREAFEGFLTNVPPPRMMPVLAQLEKENAGLRGRVAALEAAVGVLVNTLGEGSGLGAKELLAKLGSVFPAGEVPTAVERGPEPRSVFEARGGWETVQHLLDLSGPPAG